jgi:glucose/arabinose dehydrogenase
MAMVAIVVAALGVGAVDTVFIWARPGKPDRPVAATGALRVSLADFAGGFSEPVAMAITGVPADTRLFVVERAGVIRIVQANGTVLPAPFLNISSRVESQAYQEMGLLGLAFEPDYAVTRRFYVYYMTRLEPGNPNAGDNLNVARYQASANPNVADPTETTVLSIAHPNNLNHNGGQLQFGPDGYLYVGPGDGGGGGDPHDNTQHTDRLLGNLLRLNVTGVPTYTIAATNPFTQTAGARPEVWAYRLRNPWRFSFDRATSELYMGDVGPGAYEEVDYQRGGRRPELWLALLRRLAYLQTGTLQEVARSHPSGLRVRA